MWRVKGGLKYLLVKLNPVKAQSTDSRMKLTHCVLKLTEVKQVVWRMMRLMVQ